MIIYKKNWYDTPPKLIYNYKEKYLSANQKVNVPDEEGKQVS